MEQTTTKAAGMKQALDALDAARAAADAWFRANEKVLGRAAGFLRQGADRRFNDFHTSILTRDNAGAPFEGVIAELNRVRDAFTILAGGAET